MNKCHSIVVVIAFVVFTAVVVVAEPPVPSGDLVAPAGPQDFTFAQFASHQLAPPSAYPSPPQNPVSPSSPSSPSSSSSSSSNRPQQTQVVTQVPSSPSRPRPIGPISFVNPQHQTIQLTNQFVYDPLVASPSNQAFVQFVQSPHYYPSYIRYPYVKAPTIFYKPLTTPAVVVTRPTQFVPSYAPAPSRFPASPSKPKVVYGPPAQLTTTTTAKPPTIDGGYNYGRPTTVFVNNPPRFQYGPSPSSGVHYVYPASPQYFPTATHSPLYYPTAPKAPLYFTSGYGQFR